MAAPQQEGTGAWQVPAGKAELHLLGIKKENLLSRGMKTLEVALFKVQLKK